MADQKPQLLTRDELKWLMQNGHINTSEDFKKLAPPEVGMYNELMKEMRGSGDPTSRRVDSNIASGVPIIGNVAPEDALIGGQLISSGKAAAGKALRGFADSGEGFWTGVKGAMKALMEKPEMPAPNEPFGPENPMPWKMKGAAEVPPSNPFGSSTGTDFFPRGPASAAPSGPMPTTASLRVPTAAGAEAVGRGAAKADSMLESHIPNGGPAKSTSLGGPDTAGLREQPNVSTKRTAADVKEQVTGSARKGYEDSRNQSIDYPHDADTSEIQKKISSKLKSAPKTTPSSKSAKFTETDQGASELEKLLDATRGKNRSNYPNGGSANKGPLGSKLRKPK